MEPCSCGCQHIGTDVLYSLGVAMFCQECGKRGPRAHIEPDQEDWFPSSEAEAKALWNDWTRTQKLKSTLPEGGYTNDTRLSA